jgi:hypothetical protein
MGENRYKPFKDKKMSRIWMRLGTDQKEEPYMGENASPLNQNLITYL